MKYLVLAMFVGGCAYTTGPDAPSLAQSAPEYIPCSQIIAAWDANVRSLATASTVANIPFFVGAVLSGPQKVLRDREGRLRARKRECGV